MSVTILEMFSRPVIYVKLSGIDVAGITRNRSGLLTREYGKVGNENGLETGNGKWKWKCTNRWRVVLRMRKVGIAQDTAYRVEMVVCAAMEEGTKSNPINIEDWRAFCLAEGCASNPIVLHDENSVASL